jgi:hypothetical protein
MKQQLALFLRSFLISACLVFVLDLIGGKILSTIYYSQKCGIMYNTTFAIDSSKADLIILGSSKASRHYVSDLIADSTGLTVYNAGRDGTNILYANAVLLSILKRHIPKYVIVDINSFDFYKNKNIDDRLSSLLPYYDSHPEIQEIVNTRSGFEFLKLKSNIYPYNSLILNMFSNIFKPNKHEFNGYCPLFGTINTEMNDSVNFLKEEIEILKLNSLENILKLCQSNKIKCYLTQSPRFSSFVNDKVIEKINQLTQIYSIPYISFINHQEYYNKKKLFKDVAHLNNLGAIEFSNAIVQIIKSNTIKN